MRRSGNNPDFVGGRPVSRTMTPTNGQVLAYNAANKRWEAATPEAGGGLADGAVTNVKVASDAAIAWSKISKSGAAASDVGAAAATHTHAQSDVTGLTTALSGKSDTGHTHGAADIASGTIDIARLPTGTSASTVALGDHTHSIYAPVRVRNYSTASQGAGFASDTYVTGSSLLIPTGGMVAGMRFEWTITASKTAASTAVPSYNVRIGSNQSTADTSRLALTASAAQTAVTDAGILTVSVIVRNVGASGVIAGGSGWASRGGATGFGGGASNVSATFDNSNLAGQYIGLSMNGGTAAAWTVQTVYAELIP